MSEDEARAEIARARSETGLAADDVVRFGAQAFYAAIEPQIVKHQPLSTATRPCLLAAVPQQHFQLRPELGLFADRAGVIRHAPKCVDAFPASFG